jgi:hypothetical protein
MKLTEAIDIRNADLEDEWAKRFIHEIQATLDAAERAEHAKTIEERPS